VRTPDQNKRPGTVDAAAGAADNDTEHRPPAAQAIDLRKAYGTGQAEVHALAGITISFETGRFTAVMGPSGSGKSTLMHCMAGLDRPTSGSSFIGGTDVTSLSDRRLSELRRDRVGFVFQAFNLVPALTAAENITLPIDLAARKLDKAWFDHLVGELGLGQYAKAFPGIRINAVDPGYVATDINGRTGTLSVEEGAGIIVRMARIDQDGPTGGYVEASGQMAW
jgi:ABC-type glutathione transport system ATPase component